MAPLCFLCNIWVCRQEKHDAEERREAFKYPLSFGKGLDEALGAGHAEGGVHQLQEMQKRRIKAWLLQLRNVYFRDRKYRVDIKEGI